MKVFKKYIHNSSYLHPAIKLFIRYRYLVFLFFGFLMWVDVALYSGKSFVGLYSLIMVFLGLVFSSSLQGILNSFIVTLCRYFLVDEFPIQIEIFLFQWLSYFAVWFAVSSLVKRNIEGKENLIKMTTALANTLDSRDAYTAYHSANVARYAALISMEMGYKVKRCSEIKLGAQLHDIGKIGIPENILTKPSNLTKEEFDIIKTHPTIGYEMVKHIQGFEKNGVLDAILYHHEREDGSGYPKGLKSKEIPMIAKIIAVADSFDAMTSSRAYRKENNFEDAVNEILLSKGKRYDSTVVESFNRVIEREGSCILKTNNQEVKYSHSMKRNKLRN